MAGSWMPRNIQFPLIIVNVVFFLLCFFLSSTNILESTHTQFMNVPHLSLYLTLIWPYNVQLWCKYICVWSCWKEMNSCELSIFYVNSRKPSLLWLRLNYNIVKRRGFWMAYPKKTWTKDSFMQLTGRQYSVKFIFKMKYDRVSFPTL